MLRHAVEAVVFCLPFAAIAWLMDLGFRAFDAFIESLIP